MSELVPAAGFSGVLRGAVHTGFEYYPQAELTIVDGTITAINSAPDIDAPLRAEAEHTVIVPGFVDLHNHGGAGGSFPTGTTEECEAAAWYHRSRGTTTLLASLVSAPSGELVDQAARLATLARAGLIAGIHMEGPFIATSRCGAQNPAYIIPGDPHLLSQVCQAADGYLAAVTFAPETEQVDTLLQLCASYGLIASLGHSDADYATTAAVIARGQALGAQLTATHLFNAMPPVHHRAPGAAAALLSAGGQATGSAGDIGLELVADGVHLADETVDTVCATAPHAGFAVTDAMSAAGMADGDYVLGHLEVTVSQAVARLTHGGNIAGGTSTLAAQFLRRLRRRLAAGDAPGVAVSDAVTLSSTIAARVLRHAGRIRTAHTPGMLRVGEPANAVVFDLRATGDEPKFTLAGGHYLEPRDVASPLAPSA